MRKLKDKIIVITGATSGIGRATAHLLSRKGAIVAITARDGFQLDKLRSEIESKGNWCFAMATDVTDKHAVEHFINAVKNRYGRIDILVNNAAVSLFGRFEEVPYDDFRRVIETNFFGYIHTAREVIQLFRNQGYGIMINVSSQAGKIGQPFTSAYSASKFAINGLSQSLRMELRDAPDIKICTILAATFDTPLFQHAANYSGRAIKPMEPVYDAQKVSQAIFRLCKYPKPVLSVGNSGKLLLFILRFSPTLAEKLMADQVYKKHLQDKPASPSQGNLFHPAEPFGCITGGWREQSSSGNKGKTAIFVIGAVIALLLAGLKQKIK